MKTIIAGSRSIHDLTMVGDAVSASGFDVTEVVSGCAVGVDRLGEAWACNNGIPVKRFPANWNALGKAAGPVRNKQMADYADALVAIWDGKSRDTANMIGQAKSRGLKVYVYEGTNQVPCQQEANK